MSDNTHEYLVRVNYKTGRSEEFWVTKFKANAAGGSLQSVSWSGEPNEARPLHIGIDDIESIWQVDVREAG